MKNFREINTPFFSKKADEILCAVYGQFSDGLWENNRNYIKYWLNFNVERKANGQVYFKVNKNYRTNAFGGEELYDNPFKEMSDAQFLNWIADKLKAVIVAELKDNSITSREGWKRNNMTFESEYLSCNEKITVADIYVIYDWLKDRKINMSSPIVKNVFGEIRSEEQIKKIEDMQSEIEFVRANKNKLIAEVEETYNERIANLEKQLAELKYEMNNKCAEIRHNTYLKVKVIREELEKISA